MFAKKTIRMDARSVVFSDEKMFDVNDHTCVWEWVPEDQEATPRTQERWCAKIHVWGMIGVGVRELVILPSCKVTSSVYIRSCLCKVRSTLASNGLVFQQDNAPSHTADNVRAWFARNQVNVLADWPPRSPDLSPIENLWAYLQRKVSECGPLSEDDLRKFVTQEWNKIPQSLIDGLVLSFNDRLKSVLAKNRNKGRENRG
jgi:transposase